MKNYLYLKIILVKEYKNNNNNNNNNNFKKNKEIKRYYINDITYHIIYHFSSFLKISSKDSPLLSF